MRNGFSKIAAATPLTSVADCMRNVQEILSLINKVSAEGAEIVLFPELCITSSSCGDLFLQPFFIEKTQEALQQIIESSRHTDTIIIVGAPVMHISNLYNCAITIHKGSIMGITAKSHPTAEEQRWFSPACKLPANATTTLCGQNAGIGRSLVFSTPACRFGVEIGSDMRAPQAPATEMALAGAEVIFNPSATTESVCCHHSTMQFIATQSKRCHCAYIYANAGYGESTSTAVHSGANAIYENGELLASSPRFTTESQYCITEADVEKLRKIRASHNHFTATQNNSEYIAIAQVDNKECALTRSYDPTPFVPKGENAESTLEEIIMIQSLALAKRIEHTWAKSCVIGISGGLDSTLALLVTAKALDITGRPHSDITAVTMPGFGTSDRTYNNALALMKNLGVTMREISIKDACIQHFKDIEHDINVHNVTYENAQARERTQILMDIANQCSGIVVGTGDLSELALGWATYNGDHMSMYSVNASVPKTLMQHLVRHIAANSNKEVGTILLDIVDTPISPELTPADEQGNIKQKTEDLVGPYELHDFFLYHFINHGFSPAKIYLLAQNAFEGAYSNETIKKWLTTFFRRFFTQQFKRSCMPDGPKVNSSNLSPHGSWIMPSDTSYAAWITECEKL
ncbi:MAG: NAD(+) synthase [Bacteroidaceae bacterium]|nr:NAD(+) synthase [Bacteroidaceae bacterium]